MASNLVAGDTNGAEDVFIHDRQTAVTSLVSISTDGTQGNDGSWKPILSADGRVVAFVSKASNLVAGDTKGLNDIFVHDRQTGITSRVSVHSDGTQANYHSINPALSADGRYVAFETSAPTSLTRMRTIRGGMFSSTTGKRALPASSRSTPTAQRETTTRVIPLFRATAASWSLTPMP